MVCFEPEVILTNVAQLDACDLQAAPLVATHVLDPVSVGRANETGICMVGKLSIIGRHMKPHHPYGIEGCWVVVAAWQGHCGTGPRTDVRSREADGPSVSKRS